METVSASKNFLATWFVLPVNRFSSLNAFLLTGDSITLAQAVKAVGLADTGGRAKHLVRAGSISVNGTVEVQPGRKLYPGDRFGGDGMEWLVSR